MTKMSISGLMAIMVLTAAPVAVFADPAPVSAAASPTAAKPAVDPRLDSQTIVCKSEDTTGSRLGAKRICMTRQQWAETSRAARERMDDQQRQARVN